MKGFIIAMLILGSMLLGGCVNLGSRPEVKMYDFGPTAAAITTDVTTTSDRRSAPVSTIFLGPIVMRDGLDTQSMVYRLMYENPNRVATYTESAWRISPKSMIRTRFLEMTGWPGITDSNAFAGGCMVLIDVRTFEQRFNTPQNAVGMLDWEVSIINTKTRKRLDSKRLSVEQPMQKPDAASGVSALVQATDQAIEMAYRWVQNDIIPNQMSCQAISR